MIASPIEDLKNLTKNLWIDEIFWKTSPLYKAYILDILVYRQHFHKYVPANGFWFSFIKSYGQPIWNQTQFALTKSSLNFQYFEIWRRNRVFQHINIAVMAKIIQFSHCSKNQHENQYGKTKINGIVWSLWPFYNNVSFDWSNLCFNVCTSSLFVFNWLVKKYMDRRNR